MAYLGPEIMMPLASALAAIGGVILMFWRRVSAGARAVLRFAGRVFKPAQRSSVEPVAESSDVST